jgi:hypothetical protein
MKAYTHENVHEANAVAYLDTDKLRPLSLMCTLILQLFLGHYIVNLKPFLRYLQSIVRRQNFIIISFVKKCALYMIKYGTWASNNALQ